MEFVLFLGISENFVCFTNLFSSCLCSHALFWMWKVYSFRKRNQKVANEKDFGNAALHCARRKKNSEPMSSYERNNRRAERMLISEINNNMWMTRNRFRKQAKYMGSATWRFWKSLKTHLVLFLQNGYWLNRYKWKVSETKKKQKIKNHKIEMIEKSRKKRVFRHFFSLA